MQQNTICDMAQLGHVANRVVELSPGYSPLRGSQSF
jgi:hypothetical protein